MKLQRLWWTMRLYTISSARKRADYARKKHIYAEIGENVIIQSRFIPIYSELIKFHNNVSVARNVDFCTHDIIHHVINQSGLTETKLKEHIGCIEIMDNVFIGSNSTILYGTKIGPNVIIASSSIVVKDCEPNSVYAGCPAKKIGTFQDFMKRRVSDEQNGLISVTTHNQALTDVERNKAWEIFEKNHSR